MIKKNKCHPSVSVIIVNFNGKHFLKQCLFTLLKTDYPNYEIVVVDNASTDSSLAEIKMSLVSNPQIKIIENAENLGHSEGCNIGAKFTDGRYLVFLDSDIEFEDADWLKELVNVLENDSTIGLAQAKIVLSEDKRRLDCVCVAIDALGTWTANYGLKEENLKKNFEIMAASSGCSIIRREVFNFVGGFDDAYFIYDDDTDLSLRTRLLGYRVIFVPSAVVIHRSGALRGVSGVGPYYSAKNRMRTVLKNFELRNVWWKFSVLTLFTFFVSSGFFVLKKQDEAKATLRGLINSFMDLPNIWNKRLILQSKRNVKDSELVRYGFIRNDVRYTLQDFKIKMRYM